MTHAMMTRSKSRAEAAARALLEAPNTCAHCDKQDGGQGEQFAYCDTVDGWLCPEHIKQGCRNCESCCDEEDSDDDGETQLDEPNDAEDICEECNNKMYGDICNGCLRCAHCCCNCGASDDE